MVFTIRAWEHAKGVMMFIELTTQGNRFLYNLRNILQVSQVGGQTKVVLGRGPGAPTAVSIEESYDEVIDMLIEADYLIAKLEGE